MVDPQTPPEKTFWYLEDFGRLGNIGSEKEAFQKDPRSNPYKMGGLKALIKHWENPRHHLDTQMPAEGGVLGRVLGVQMLLNR